MLVNNFKQTNKQTSQKTVKEGSLSFRVFKFDLYCFKLHLKKKCVKLLKDECTPLGCAQGAEKISLSQ